MGKEADNTKNKVKGKKYLITGIVAFVVLLIAGNVIYNVIHNNLKNKQNSGNEAVVTKNLTGTDEGTLTGNTLETTDETNVSDADTSGKTDDTEVSSDNEEDLKENSSEESSEETETDLTEDGTPVEVHGKLSLDGTQIVDKNGKAYQLRGVSTHGIAWFPGYVNYDAFQTIRDEWGANCIRIAMYSGENNGYCTGGDQNRLKGLVNDGVEYATELGMYVIIDWHVLGDQDPNTYKSQAKEFFKEMSSKYADYDNVIYEICNEPNGGVTWSSVKSYAEEVIPIIKANDPEAIIIVGTPTWSQDVDQAAADPITGYTNIMYALHFYADTHRDSLRSRMVNAINAGLPIYVTEFGICDASGAGANNYDEGNKWIETMDSFGVSYNIWSLCNKNETASLISSSCSKTSGWTESDLSDSGKWYVGVLGKNVTLGSTSGNSNSSNNSSNNNSNGSSGNNSNNGGSNSSGSNSGSTSGGSASASSGTLKASANCTGNWNDGTNNYYQYTITLSADGGSVSNWKVSINFGSNVSIDQSWSGNFALNGSTVTVTPVDYNSTINSGNSCEVGLIVYTPGSVGTPTVSIN